MTAAIKTQRSARPQLDSFLAKFDPAVASLASSALACLRRRYPTALELVYDNYNALAIGFSPSERASEGIFSIAVYPKWVSLFFLQGRNLSDPRGILQGGGNVARHIRLASLATLDEPAVLALMRQAAAAARVPFDPRGTHQLIIKSVSLKQRPRRPVAARKSVAASKTAAGKALSR